MKHLVCGVVLLAATLGMAQQGQPPPGATPPTFPEGQRSPRTPPDEQAPPSVSPSAQVAQEITHRISQEPALANANLDAKVDESSVVLSGTVDTQGQHDMALRIAQSYAGDRNLVDKIKVKQRA